MLNLSEFIYYYLRITFLEDVRKQIYLSFNYLEMFGNLYYEDKLIETIESVNLDSDSKQDTFISIVKEELTTIVTEHYITLSIDYNPSLEELNELVGFIYLLENLENYDLVSYRVHSEDTPRNIITDLIEHYSGLSKFRAMELIKEVDSKLIIALRNLCIDKIKETTIAIDKDNLDTFTKFIKFIDNHTCLGATMKDKGYINFTLEELSALSINDISDLIDKTIVTNKEQASLDVLSILLLCKDTYKKPLENFKQYNHIFSTDSNNISILTNTISKILNDFYIYIDGNKQLIAASSGEIPND